MKSPKFWTVFLLLAATALVLYSRGDVDRVPPSDPLSYMPKTIDGLTAEDLPLDSETLAVLGKGDFLNRIYVTPVPAIQQASTQSAPRSAIGVFIGYFATQRTGQTIHSPQHCLPGAGWTFESQKYVNLQDVDGKNYKVGEYVINNGSSRQFVIYWYQAHGRSIANEYVAKAYMVSDAIRTNRTDGALVRVITAISPAESVDTARERAVRFTSKMAPFLPRFIPD
ncbi:MAG TPA: EpsI family protein [Edaphobacter sp.]|nr:EpsI family protein [Edaphobacter sp.]